MSVHSPHLGGRLPLLDPASMQGKQRELYDEINQTMVAWVEAVGFRSKTPDGRLIGPFNTAVFSPDIGGAFLTLQALEKKHTSLDERVRQIVILTVGSIWKSPYELYAHAASAGKTGLSEDAVRALRAGNLQPNSPRCSEPRNGSLGS